MQLKDSEISVKNAQMIRVFSEENKEVVTVIAVADHQRDLNNLRLMSYSLYDGKDRLQLNKQDFGGPYLKIKCDECMDANGKYDTAAIESKVLELRALYN